MARKITRALPTRSQPVASLGLALLMIVALAPTANAARDDYKQVVAITFPVAGKVSYGDDYKAGRSGGRRHQATDIFAPKGTPVFAAVTGTVCFMSGVPGPMPSYGYILHLCGDDGRQYSYVHLNNDRPGTDDGRGGPAAAFAPGIRKGLRVNAGQHLGFVGDSGNAERTRPHLHFEIEDPNLRDPRLTPAPWKEDRINPYASLVAAQRRGAAPATGRRLMKLQRPHQRGADVKAFQQGLATLGLRNSRGRPLTIDGFFGPETDQAARAFQKRVGLDPSGLVGPKTLTALARSLAAGQPSRSRPSSSTAWPGRYLKLNDPYMRGSDVKAFQARLSALGYKNSAGRTLGADGVWGPETDRAARRFIADARLPNIPIVGPKTWSKAFGR